MMSRQKKRDVIKHPHKGDEIQKTKYFRRRCLSFPDSIKHRVRVSIASFLGKHFRCADDPEILGKPGESETEYNPEMNVTCEKCRQDSQADPEIEMKDSEMEDRKKNSKQKQPSKS